MTHNYTKLSNICIHTLLLLILVSIILPSNAMCQEYEWPAVPSADKSLTVSGALRGESANVMLPRVEFAPIPLNSPPNDPLQVFANNTFKGMIVDLPYLKVDGYNESQQYYALYGVNFEAKYQQETKSQIAYHATYSISYLQSPMFSPDGKKVLYKGGSLFGQGAAYRLFVWNFKKNIIDQAMEKEAEGEDIVIIPQWHHDVYWSPDSRYILYTIPSWTVDGIGNKRYDHDNITLNVYDLEEKKNRIVAKNIALRVLVANIKTFYWQAAPYSTFQWTPQKTVLFTKQQMRTEEEIQEKRAANVLLEPYRPNIYEIGLDGGKANLLIPSATNPLPSPDGKLIAFWGWPNEKSAKTSEDKKEEAVEESDVPKLQLPALYIYERSTKKRRKISDFLSGRLVWTPDNKSLLILNPSNNQRQENSLYRIDVTKGTSVKIADIIAADAKDEMRHYRTFDNLKVSRNGKYAIIDAVYGLESDSSDFVNPEMKVFLGVDLATGKITKIAQCQNRWASVLGWDWYDMSTPVK